MPQTTTAPVPTDPPPADPVLLSLFGHRFQGIAESAGLTLQRTSLSANIKERLDYSVAIFDASGALVANAPHLPVHLGSMSFAVRYQTQFLDPASASGGEGILPGDVILANHPAAGGSHLPDMTVISPVFAPDQKTIIFYTASRGHHVDIGGILPGSMPPTSTKLFQEGAQIKSFKLVRQGVYDHEGLYKYLVRDPAQFPGCSGSRAFRDVESDLQAQIAANNKGIKSLQALVEEWSLATVQEYMVHIRNNAELSVRNLLRDVAGIHGTELKAIDYMDDGSPIQLRITIDPQAGSAIFDFKGTGPEVIANFNCPRAVVHSAIIYCLRAMVTVDIPLNQGCLVPVDVRIPPGSMLDPSDTAAVVGGNVMTSQRITDVVLHAFQAAAASQGCCNNLTWGTPVDENGQGVSNYETIAGGSGAGPNWNGTSGVHVHMTNTRITDAEILEKRFPVLLRQFQLRPGSGGQGQYNGGDGTVRETEFLTPGMQVSILSERRVHRPYGMHGGEPGQTGLNLWIKQRREEDGDLLTPEQVAAQPPEVRNAHPDGQSPRVINMGPKSTVTMGRGDRIAVYTPGGGGWGHFSTPERSVTRSAASSPARHVHQPRGSVAEWQAMQLGA